MPTTKAKTSSVALKRQVIAKLKAKAKPVPTIAPRATPASSLFSTTTKIVSVTPDEQVTPISAQQRAALEGAPLALSKSFAPIPEIDSSPADTGPKKRGRPRNPESNTEPVDPKFKGARGCRLKELDNAHQATNANQNLTTVKVGPKRSSSSASDGALELSETNLGYLDGFISQVQPKARFVRSANTLSAGYSLEERAQATAALSPSRATSPELPEEELDDPEVTAEEEVTPKAELEPEVSPVPVSAYTFLDDPLSPEIELMVIDERLRSGEFALPRYESELAAGIDLRAMLAEDTELKPNSTMLVPTGIALNMGKSGMCATVLPRSGFGFKHGIVLGNLVGLIDADYQGELMVPLWNRSRRAFTIKVGMRIAQMVFLPIIRPRFKQVEAFTPTERGTKGFGSTDHD